ncbi:MAG: CHAP domain-containing protein, partial [Anaerolineae bacterium]|nr:CHAP domain-containing protein [Anaerolineae bacterium]
MIDRAFRLILASCLTMGLMLPSHVATIAARSQHVALPINNSVFTSAKMADPTPTPLSNREILTPDYIEHECTWWAWYRGDQTGWDVPLNLAHAHDWNDNAPANGLTVSTTPMGGSIAVWEADCAGADEDYGHVAFVEYVTENGQIHISEYNWNVPHGHGTRTIDPPWCMTFIYRPYPTLFQHIDYAGAWRHFDSSYGDFAGMTYDYPENNGVGLNDSASSIWVPPLWSLFLYRHSSAQGRCGSKGFECAYSNVHNLTFSDGTIVGDNASSIWIGYLMCLYDFQCQGTYATCTEPSLGQIGVRETGINGICSGTPSPCLGPTLRDPPNGHIETADRSVTFRWNEVDCDHSGFTFRIKTVPDMESGGQIVVDVGESGTERTETFSSQWDNQDLYWSVRAANAPGGAAWAPSRVFRIEPNASPSISFNTANGNTFPSGRIESRDRNWTFQGTASDPDGSVNRVEFRCGSPCDNTGSGPGQ